MTKSAATPLPSLSVRIDLDSEERIGPGKILLLEKIQGRPLSARTQAIAQYVGLAFLAGVFLFVTYHDILRFI